MPEKRTTTLLDFAIVASAAVLPVLLAVLLAVDLARPLVGGTGAGDGERHVSVRELAALKTFERAIVPRHAVTQGPPTAGLILERVPQCRSAWDGHEGLITRLRRVLGHGPAPASPAQRLEVELADLDDELLRFSTGAQRRVEEAVGFDATRWFDAVSVALQVPVAAGDYPGHEFRLQCADIAGAVAKLARANGHLLAVLSWRGSEGQRTIAHWRPDQFVEVTARQVARANPWQGLLGCVFMGGGAAAPATPAYFVSSPGLVDQELCERREMFADGKEPAVAVPTGIAGEPTLDLPVNDERWKVPPSLDALLRPLATLRRPSGALYRLYTEANVAGEGVNAYRYGPNRIDVGGSPVDVGFSVDLTIEPSLQALAQRTAACYTGRHDVCTALGMARAEDAGHALGYRMLEQAEVRMAAVAVVDVESGRIEALASAFSPCARHEYDGAGHAAGCDKRLPYHARYRPDALLNGAVYFDAMPGSIIKPIMAVAFLTDPDVGAQWLAAERKAMREPGPPNADSMRGQLARSNSARFLDRMFCADQDFGHCQRPWRVQATAAAFGWNADCAAPREDCGKQDLLFGRVVDTAAEPELAPLATLVPYGRLLVEPVGGKLDAPFGLRPAVVLDTNRLRACAAGADGRRLTRDDWEKCRGGMVVDVVAEGWGQGHARASALGVAGMMAALAAAANGQPDLQRPHLISGLRGVASDDSTQLPSAVSHFGLDAPRPNTLSRDAAQVILSGLSYSHRVGTARLACEQVFGARACKQMDWIAGKTGTPTFPNDARSLDEIWRLCGRGQAWTHSEQAACAPLRPYKWYVAAYRSEGADQRWTKVIAVLTERNWIKDTGRIQGAGDQGPNPAAEIALQIAARDTGFLPGTGQ
jgi:cell division protein FtsI/penicillin-binding protein 2